MAGIIVTGWVVRVSRKWETFDDVIGKYGVQGWRVVAVNLAVAFVVWNRNRNSCRYVICLLDIVRYRKDRYRLDETP